LPPCSPQAVALWSKRGKAELIEVLSQIQEVLAEEGEEEGEEEEAAGRLAVPRPLSSRPGRGAPSGCCGGGGLHLPPEVGDGPVHASKSHAAAAEGGLAAGRGGRSSAADNAQKVEGLRMDLEQALGSGKFLEAYRCVHRLVAVVTTQWDTSTGAWACARKSVLMLRGRDVPNFADAG
jgi:hypothetical protein